MLVRQDSRPGRSGPFRRHTGEAAGGGAGITASCPQRTQAGGFDQVQLELEETLSDIAGLTRYDADPLGGTGLEPVPLGTGGAGSTWRSKSHQSRATTTSCSRCGALNSNPEP
jgi:hypothetical protein